MKNWNDAFNFDFTKPAKKRQEKKKKKVCEDCTGKAYYWLYTDCGKYVKKYSQEEVDQMKKSTTAQIHKWRFVKIMN